MKKIKKLLLVLLVAVLSTGCVKFNAHMDIKKDKSMDFSIIYAFDKTVFGENGLKEEDMKEAEKQGFTVSKYSEGNMEGFTLTKKIKNIDEFSTESDAEYNLSGMMEENAENKYLFKVVKGKDKNTYYAKFKFDANDSGLNTNGMEDDEELPDIDENNVTTEGNNSLENMDLNGMMSSLDLSFSVNLPYSAISSNATTKEEDNKKLTWKLNTDSKEYIEFAFELNNSENSNTILYIGIGALALVLIVAVVLVATKKKKDNVVPKKVPEETENKSNE